METDQEELGVSCLLPKCPEWGRLDARFDAWLLEQGCWPALLSQDSGMETGHLSSMAVLQENVCSVAEDSAWCWESLHPVPDPLLTGS